MKKIFTLLLLAASTTATAQLNIIPMPADLKPGKGFCIIKEPIGFIALDVDKEGGNDGVEHFRQYLKKTYRITQFTNGDTHSYGLPTEIFYTTPGEKKPAGYYELEVTGNKIYIKGTALGKFYAFQTLKQLITRNNKGQLVVPHCSIKDHPRFAYRGMHFDVCRHIFPVSFIKKYIDHLATYKFNTFHWHLTDDQGWRVEIKKYPKLTSVGGYRNGTIIGRYPGTGNDSIYYGGYYTQAQIKEVVRYAAERHITVIPEIEMPGHSSAAIAAYPQLSCFPGEDVQVPDNTAWAGSRKGKQVQQSGGVFEDIFCPTEYTFGFLEDVLDEVMQLFPSKYIHIGGDETPKAAWQRSAFCRQLMKEQGLKDEHELQSYFIRRIEKYINSKGRKIIGWDEILEGGLAPNAAVMSWRGEEGGIAAAKQGHDVVMTPGDHCYFDHSQSRNEDSVTFGSYLPLESVYGYDPVPASLNAREAKHILGAQGNMWTEYMANEAKVEYMLFPRIAALSEAVWTPKEKKSWPSFEKRLPGLFKRLDEQKINYSKAYYDLKDSLYAYDGKIRWELKSNSGYPVKAAVYPGMNRSGSYRNYDLAPVYKGPIDLYSSGIAVGILADPAAKKILSKIEREFHFTKATAKKITLANGPNKSYPGNGAFTLVDGICNADGLNRSNEFLGFWGKDLDAVIDLGRIVDVNSITLYVYDLNASWIYLPSRVEVTYLPDSDLTEAVIAAAPKVARIIDPIKDKGARTITIESKQQCRYVHIVAKNFGIIPNNNPGAGNPAWLFVDEIAIE